jgi:hypothetical protein
MHLTRGAMKADFTAIGGRWVVVEKDNYAAAPAKVRQLLLGLADLTLVEPKTTRADLLGRLDLDDPSNGRSTLIKLTSRTGGTVAELILGRTRRDRFGRGKDGIYIRKPAESRAWLARGSLDLPQNLDDWLDRRIIDLSPSRVASVTLTGSNGLVVVLKRGEPDGPLAVAEAPGDGKIQDQSLLALPAAVLAGLEFEDVKPTAQVPVPENGVATALFTTFDGLVVTVWLFAHEGSDWITMEAVGRGDAATDAKAIDARVAHWTYKILPDRAKPLRVTFSDLVRPAKGG